MCWLVHFRLHHEANRCARAMEELALLHPNVAVTCYDCGQKKYVLRLPKVRACAS